MDRASYPGGLSFELFMASTFKTATPELLFELSGGEDSSIDLLGALPINEWSQDTCWTTSAIEDLDLSENPIFTGQTGALSLRVPEGAFKLGSARISGVFGPDATEFRGGTLSGEWDARNDASMRTILGTDDPDEICRVLLSLNVRCGLCKSDESPYCINFLAHEVDGELIDLDALTCIAEDSCYPTCETSTCETVQDGICE